MQTIQLAFVLLVILILAGLLVDGLMTRAVWVKGARDGLFSFRQWAHKRSREEDPWTYWFAMIFYGAAMLGLCVLLLTE